MLIPQVALEIDDPVSTSSDELFANAGQEICNPSIHTLVHL